MINFSIVIPLYNKKGYVSKTIDSVLAQTHSGFECIVVDDGSTDGSSSEVERYQDPRIKLVRKENGGVSQARNVGISMAENEYIAFLDADDSWMPEYLESIAALIGKHPGLDLYFTSHFWEMPGERKIVEAREIAEKGESGVFNLFEYFRKYQKYDWPIHTSCCVVSKNAILRAGGFDERISYYEDYDLFSRIALHSQLAYLNKPLTFYNCDLPPELRLTGNRPPLSKHWGNYILEGPLYASSDSDVAYFTHNFAVRLLRAYRLRGIDCVRVRKLRKKIQRSLLSHQANIQFSSPVFVLRGLAYLKARVKIFLQIS